MKLFNFLATILDIRSIEWGINTHTHTHRAALMSFRKDKEREISRKELRLLLFSDDYTSRGDRESFLYLLQFFNLYSKHCVYERAARKRSSRVSIISVEEENR